MEAANRAAHVGGGTAEYRRDREPALDCEVGARRIDELGNRILTEIHALFRFDEFYLVLVDRDTQLLDLRVHERSGEQLPARFKPIDAGLFGWVARRGEAVLVENWALAPERLRDRAELTEKTTGSLIIVPLIEEGEVIGLLSIGDLVQATIEYQQFLIKQLESYIQG